MNYLKAVGLAVVFTAVSLAQDVISARSGMIHYTEGTITLNGKSFARKSTEFPAMKIGEELRSELGRAEVLLTPGVFLRIAENSAFRLLKNDLTDTKLELLAGSALLEVSETAKDQSLAAVVGERTVEFAKKGLFRLDFNPAQIRVYDGAATVITPEGSVTVKEGRQTGLFGAVNPVKFNKDEGDSFYRWASRRSGYIAAANLSAAKRVHDNQSFYGSNSWVFNPWLGMFTYLPLNGMYRSPFGYSFFSPGTVSRVYYRPPVIYNPWPAGGGSGMGMDAGMGGRGMSGMGGGGRGMGTYSSGGSMAAPPPSAGGAAPSGGPRMGGGGGMGAGGGRGGSSGR